MVSIAISTIVFSLCASSECKAALLDGYNICVSELLFALFPFLIAANLLVTCEIDSFLSRPFRPLCRLLGFSEPCVSGLLAIALLGGFAPAISALSQNVKSGHITPQRASHLLPALCFLGPSYIILAIGQGMLGNIWVGIYLFASQILASFLAVLLLRIPPLRKSSYKSGQHSNTSFVAQATTTLGTVNNSSISQGSISSIIGDSFFAFLKLCGVILYFQFLFAGISSFAPIQYQWIFATSLEVTAACERISNIGIHASFRCCTALSLLSGSILLQIRALCPQSVSLKYLLYTRFLHLPLSLLVFRLFLCLPQAQNVYSSFSERVFTMQKLPLDQALLLFISLIFLAERLAKPLQRR